MNELALFDQRFFNQKIKRLAGVDEVGRGPLAGPVVAAVCSFPKEVCFPQINDSKRLSAKRRKALDHLLRAEPKCVFAIGFVFTETIDQHNIHQASLMAMADALQKLQSNIDYLLIDGPFWPQSQRQIPIAIAKENCCPIVKGDAKSQVIAAASILAKVARDDYMCIADQRWPQYGFAQNKGYPTKDHFTALVEYGPCPIHRRSFRLAPQQKAAVKAG